jgi:hypothetical protein
MQSSLCPRFSSFRTVTCAPHHFSHAPFFP